MSLTILFHRTVPQVGIVRWFRDPKVSLVYASGPVVQMPLEEFRKVGYDWVRRHFEEYNNTRLPQEKATPVFQPGQEKTLLKDCVAVWIKPEESGDLKFIPQVFKKYSLVGTENLPKESRRTIPACSSADIFWETLDRAAADALAADA